MFAKYHYLSHSHNNAARCFLLFVDDVLAGFSSVLPFPHPKLKKAYREHRTVLFPDFQGVGLGSILSDFVAQKITDEGKIFLSTTTNPAFINYRAKSPKWIATRKGRAGAQGKTSGRQNMKNSKSRVTVSFRYIGNDTKATKATQ